MDDLVGVTDYKKVFYKKTLGASEEGLRILTKKWVSIYETPFFHFCIPEHEVKYLNVLRNKSETVLDYSRRRKFLKKIAKTRSRYAFDTEEQALAHLKFLKRKQLEHIKRDMTFIRRLLSAPEDQLSSGLILETEELVREHYIFD